MSNPVQRYNEQFAPVIEPPEVQPRAYTPSTAAWSYSDAMDLAREVIADVGAEVMGEKVHHGNHVFMLKHCIFDPSHRNNDAAVMVGPTGLLMYKCFHNSCADRSWGDVRALSGVSKCKQVSANGSSWEQGHGACKQVKASVSTCQPMSADVSEVSASGISSDIDKPIMHAVYDYIMQGSGTFNVFDLDRELCLFTRAEKNARARALNYHKKRGFILPVTARRGQWRTVDKNCRGMKLGLSKSKPLPIVLPLGLHELCDLRPGNIVVVAGSPNSGKSAYVSNLCHSVFVKTIEGEEAKNYEASVAAQMATQICPGQKLECHFFSSEAGEDEMSSRLALHPGGIESFNDVSFWERDRDFADVIRPNAINVVDFLEVYDDFYQIGGWINDIHRVLDKGIAIIVIQKKRGRDVGKGGDVTMEKPRLYISLENNAPYGGICKVVKAKFPKSHSMNPNGMEIDYSLHDGHEFRARSEWRFVDGEKARERINLEYKAKQSDRGYMFNFVTIEGEVKGLAKRDVDSWTTAYPRIYVVGELIKAEEVSKTKPFLTSKDWFFELSGMLSKKNSAKA